MGAESPKKTTIIHDNRHTGGKRETDRQKQRQAERKKERKTSKILMAFEILFI